MKHSSPEQPMTGKALPAPDGDGLPDVEMTSCERQFAAAVGCRYTVAARNAGMAAASVFSGLGIGPGDEVLVSCLCPPDLVAAIRRAGAVPVPVDLNPETLQICPESADRAVTSRSRALLISHTNGLRPDLRLLRVLAACNDLQVIEDCTEAFGAGTSGIPAAFPSQAAIFRLAPPEGGADCHVPALIATDIQRLAAALAAPTAPPVRSAFIVPEILATMLTYASLAVPRRSRAVQLFREHLEHLEEVLLPPSPGEDSLAAPARLIIRVPDQTALVANLRARGIDARPIRLCSEFLPRSREEAERFLRRLPNGVELAHSGVSLPLRPECGEKDVLEACLEIRAHYAERRVNAVIALAGGAPRSFRSYSRRTDQASLPHPPSAN